MVTAIPGAPRFAACALMALAALVVACGHAVPAAAIRPAAPGATTATTGGAAATPAPATAATPGDLVRRAPVVVLDPGHAADESGAVANGVVEKDSNLDMALRVAAVLRPKGIEVVLTRTSDARANAPDGSAQPQGYNGTRLDLQARVKIADAAHADLFVSLHANGAADPSVRGFEVYYNASRPFSDQNKTLAGLLLDGVTTELRAVGLPAMGRGAIDDSCLKAFQGRCFPLFVLGPPRVTSRDEVLRRGGNPDTLGFAPGQDSISSPATEMPGALVELLFISSPDDAALLRNDVARDTLARGVARGIVDFLGQEREGG